MNFWWAVLFFILAAALTTYGYGHVHEGVLGGLILLSFLAAAGFYLKHLDERAR